MSSTAEHVRQETTGQIVAHATQELRRQLAAVAAERDAWREHARTDCAALGRVWHLARAWEARAGDDTTVTGRLFRGLAADLRKAMVTEREGSEHG